MRIKMYISIEIVELWMGNTGLPVLTGSPSKQGNNLSRMLEMVELNLRRPLEAASIS